MGGDRGRILRPDLRNWTPQVLLNPTVDLGLFQPLLSKIQMFDTAQLTVNTGSEGNVKLNLRPRSTECCSKGSLGVGGMSEDRR